jgi:hypothetical protein
MTLASRIIRHLSRTWCDSLPLQLDKEPWEEICLENEELMRLKEKTTELTESEFTVVIKPDLYSVSSLGDSATGVK